MQNILIAVTGLTPQVITETLYYLTQVKKPPVMISEIYVITTLSGRKEIMKNLLNEGKGKYFEFLKEYTIHPDSILFDGDCIFVARDKKGNMINDIRTTEESSAFANFTMQIIKRKTEDKDKTIIASVAGGRKTMSVYMAYALQLFGRQQDVLTHVLVNEDFEMNPDFYYIPKQPQELITRNGKKITTADARIELVEVPFIRLREKLSSVFGDDDKTYEEMVKYSQHEIDRITPVFPLKLTLSERLVTAGPVSFRLQPLHYAIYYFMANSKAKECPITERKSCRGCTKCFVTIGEITEKKNLEKILTFYEKMFGQGSLHVEKMQVRFTKPPVGFMDSFRAYFAKINKVINKNFNEGAEQYEISSSGGYGARKYGIKIDKSLIKLEQ